MRPRLTLVVVPALVLLLAAASALAVRIQTGPSHSLPYKGSDGRGAVTLQFTYLEHIHKGGSVTHTITLDPFRFANSCAGHGSRVPGTIKVAADARFDYHAPGFAVAGHLVGSSYQPREIVGSARVVTADCDSGVLAFSAKPH
jgi:hypothetical protein